MAERLPWKSANLRAGPVAGREAVRGRARRRRPLVGSFLLGTAILRFALDRFLAVARWGRDLDAPSGGSCDGGRRGGLG